LEKGRTLAADALILDLEDAVAPDAKEMARQQILDALATGGYGQREILVRVNGLDSEWGSDDITAMAKSGADAILLPKVESAGFVMGTSDLAKDLHCLHTPGRLPFVTSLSLCVLAARAHGLAILDGVHLDLEDDEGFAESCRQGLEFGFDGKTLIHPRTIAKANEVFAPSAEEIAWSERIIAAHEEASAQGKGVVVVDGKLVENLHVENAKRIVGLAAMIGEMESAAG
jgi:citrate lyase subunit beta/citryl-CoA lyase